MREQFVLDFTREKFFKMRWPFFKQKEVFISENDSIKVRDAFLKYLEDNREYYITAPKIKNRDI